MILIKETRDGCGTVVILIIIGTQGLWGTVVILIIIGTQGLNMPLVVTIRTIRSLGAHCYQNKFVASSESSKLIQKGICVDPLGPQYTYSNMVVIIVAGKNTIERKMKLN